MTDDERQGLLMTDFMRVPNIILQMQQVLKNGNTYACLQFIWSKTGGWGRNEDTIAYSQFANDKRYGTGLSIKTIQRSVEKLADLGVITIAPSFNNMHEFTLNIEKVKELVGEQAKSNSPSLEDTSQVNLSASQVNLSASQDYLSDKPSQIVLHTRTTTQEPLHKKITQEVESKPKKTKSKKDDSLTEKANAIVDYWNDNHGKGANANVKHAVWAKVIKTRLKIFTEEEICMAMQSIINSTWHQQNNQVLIKNAIDSNERCAKALEKSSSVATAKSIDRSTDKLAVNNNWGGANKSNIVAANSTIEDMLGDNA